MNSIISSVIKREKKEKSNIKATKKYKESFGEHPFN